MRNDKFWDECVQGTLRYDLAHFLSSLPELDKLSANKRRNLEDSIMSFIEGKQYDIYNTVEQSSQIDDMIDEFSSENVDKDEVVRSLPFEVLKDIQTDFIDILSNDDSYWEAYWYCIREALYSRKELDLRQYENQQEALKEYARYLKAFYATNGDRDKVLTIKEYFDSIEKINRDKITNEFNKLLE